MWGCHPRRDHHPAGSVSRSKKAVRAHRTPLYASSPTELVHSTNDGTTLVAGVVDHGVARDEVSVSSTCAVPRPPTCDGRAMGWTSPEVLAALGGGWALLAALVVIETCVADPIVRLGLRVAMRDVPAQSFRRPTAFTPRHESPCGDERTLTRRRSWGRNVS
jgi:hypothetical protein